MTMRNAWNSTGQSELRGLSSHDGPARVSLENFDGLGRWRETTGLGPGRSMPRAFCPTAPRLTDQRAARSA